MALICPKCGTRNRSIAKFCIECITSLPTGCADTDFAPATPAAPNASYLNLIRALDALGGRSSKPAPRVAKEKATKEAAPASTFRWISVASLITLLAVGSAGWLVARAGGWYLYTAGSAQVDPPRPDGFATEVAPAKNAPEIQEAPGQAAPASANVQAQIAPVPERTHPIDAQGEADRQVAAPVATAVRSLSKPKALPPADPMASCSGMNFIAEAQCMASQCLKPAFKSHAKCEAVRRQQRLEDGKRNPIAP